MNISPFGKALGRIGFQFEDSAAGTDGNFVMTGALGGARLRDDAAPRLSPRRRVVVRVRYSAMCE